MANIKLCWQSDQEEPSRFPEEKVRPMGRTASGVRGIRLADDVTDIVIGMITIENKEKDSTCCIGERIRQKIGY